MRIAEIERRIQALETLSSPPGSIDRIFALAADCESRIQNLAVAIQSDPAVAARLIRLANSAYFGFPSRIASVTKAIVVLGYRTVQNLAACVALAPAFRGGRGALDRCELWLHSCAVAEAARLVALELSEDAPTAYLGGLLHDIGQVVLDETVPREYAKVVDAIAKEGLGIAEAEERILGIDHPCAGGILAERWNLPEILADAMRRHERLDAEAPVLLRIIVLGENLALQEGFLAIEGEPVPEAVPARLLGDLSFDPERLETVAERFKQRRDALELLHRESWKGGS